MFAISLFAPLSSVLLSDHVPHSPLDVSVGVGLNEGVDRSDLAGLVVVVAVVAVVVRLGQDFIQWGQVTGTDVPGSWSTTQGSKGSGSCLTTNTVESVS